MGKARNLSDLLAVDGQVENPKIDGVAASKLTGALPAISGASLTSIPAGNLTGTIVAARLDTATTQAESDDSTKIATTAYVVDKITTLIGGAPSTLNDLNELALAINDDNDYNSTLTTALATKLPLAGGTMTGDIAHAGNFTINTLAYECFAASSISAYPFNPTSP
jgi:hypothetical protein